MNIPDIGFKNAKNTKHDLHFFNFFKISDSGKINVIDNSALCDNDRSINEDDDEHDMQDDGVSQMSLYPNVASLDLHDNSFFNKCFQNKM